MAYPAWGRGGGGSGGGHADMRRRQIESLVRDVPSTKAVKANHVYAVHLPRVEGQNVSLRILLIPNFPERAPMIQVVGDGERPFPLRHPWVGSNSVLDKCPKLTSWNVHSSLGRTVLEIVEEFGPSTLQRGAGASTSTQEKEIALPETPTVFPEFEAMTQEERDDLLLEGDLFEAFFFNLPQVKQVQQIRDSLWSENEELAKQNLSQEEVFQEGKSENDALREVVLEKKKVVEDKLAQQQALMKRLSSSEALEKLHKAALEAESESEQIASQFLDGEMSFKDFKKSFLPLRRKYHERMCKRERFIVTEKEAKDKVPVSVP